MTWKTLRHPNVLPLLGVTMTTEPYRFVMVSEWMENGTINEFLQHVDADRLELVRVLLCPHLAQYLLHNRCSLKMSLGG